MRLPPDFMPDFGSLLLLLLDMAKERSLESLQNLLVGRLAQRPAIALAQLWLQREVDTCRSCPFQSQCRPPCACLHLMAWASRYNPGPSAEAIRGSHVPERIPRGVGTIGQVAHSKTQMKIANFQDDRYFPPLPSFVPRREVVSFLGTPLIKNDEVLGVLVTYVRMEPLPQGEVWSQVLADFTASAIANTQAFETIETLRKQLEIENEYLRKEVIETSAFGDIIGQSAGVHAVIRSINLVAPTDATVLIQGESGTGKELVAREIYRRSSRRDRALIKINCASVPKELFESEFFGHTKGAFTGAIRDRAGRFEAANHGTLFLDEVGEIPLEVQGKLLRVLQDGVYERVGEEISRRVDVRIIAATNKDLHREVERGRFREDLFYRLNVFPLEVPPLRDRKEDIPLLADHCLKQSCTKMNRLVPALVSRHLQALNAYDWPGNVRELQNIIERAVITLRGGRLQFDLPGHSKPQSFPKNALRKTEAKPPDTVRTEADMQALMCENIRTALRTCHGKIYGPDGAARLLRIKPTTLSARIKKFGIGCPE